MGCNSGFELVSIRFFSLKSFLFFLIFQETVSFRFIRFPESVSFRFIRFPESVSFYFTHF